MMNTKTASITGRQSISNVMHFDRGGSENAVPIPIHIPNYSSVNVRELGWELIHKHKIETHLQEQFFTQLKNFIDNEIEAAEDLHFEDVCDENSDKSNRFSSVLKAATARIRESEDSNLRQRNPFWQRYHMLIHSGLLTEALVALEHSFSLAIQNMTHDRDQAIQSVRNHQTQEMEQMLARVGHSVSEQDVNKLSVTHFAELDDLRKMWERSLSDQKKQQRQEFEDWITKLYQDWQNEKGDRKEIVQKIRDWTDTSAPSMSHSSAEQPDDGDLSHANVMDESFTINLGAQLKTTHNLRLLSRGILEMCRNRDGASQSLPTPQRIQTAMSLFSSSLSGLVLLVDNRVSSYSSLKKEFADLCERSTDFHFPSLSEQLTQVRRELELRSESGQSATLRVGDFYTTKHSNLSEIHAVFHLVSDESVLSAEITSRHPLLMGLRNVLKTAYLCDITTISLPLLLVHEMSENMTLQWCLRRAELVFKCVKGFMIEMASLTPTSDGNRTLKFVLPEGIQEQLFLSLAAMLPSIFRLSNPLVLSSHNSH
jgi:hypothetical protein